MIASDAMTTLAGTVTVLVDAGITQGQPMANWWDAPREELCGLSPFRLSELNRNADLTVFALALHDTAAMHPTVGSWS